MARRRLSQREKMAVGVGVVGCVLILVVMYIVLPFFDAKAAAAAELEGKAHLLQRSLAAIQQRESLQLELEAVERLVEHYRQGLLDGQDANVASIQLQEIVGNLAGAQGVRITRSTPVGERKIGERYLRIALQINIDTDLSGLLNFLHALSSHSKFLVVDECFVNSFRQQNRTVLQPRMNISGFLRL